jgi:hypothetical protein
MDDNLQSSANSSTRGKTGAEADAKRRARRSVSAAATAAILRTGAQKVALPAEIRLRQPHKGKRSVTLARLAMEWTYIVRNRRRWLTLPNLKRQKVAEAGEDLGHFGVQEKYLDAFADAQMVEVSVPWTEEERQNWPARILPWEYLVSSATDSRRNDSAITVVRHLDRPGDKRADTKFNKRVLFVESQPGPLQDWYQFKTERELVQSNLSGAKGAGNWKALYNPTERNLRDALSEHQPDVVHLAGFDTHQALSVLLQREKEEGRKFEDLWDPAKDQPDPTKEGAARDGYVLKGEEKFSERWMPSNWRTSSPAKRSLVRRASWFSTSTIPPRAWHPWR